ncbi:MULTISPECIES: hypothetical protein [Paraburkholderia]|uniref:hypothetical protein n=1 Tax=Paraburkholderia TaxID=1822464 RepID=UPI0038BAC8DB
MNKQKQTVGSGKAALGAHPPSERSLRLVESAALIGACGNFVVQLDAHRVGAAIFLGIIAIAVVALALARRPGTASGRHVDKSGQIDSPDIRPEFSQDASHHR